MSLTAEMRDIFDSLDKFKEEIAQKEEIITELRTLLKQEQSFRKRLEEKLAALDMDEEALDAWDQEFLFQRRCVVKFRMKDMTHQVAIKPIGLPTVRAHGPKPAGLLRKAIWEASGRKG